MVIDSRSGMWRFAIVYVNGEAQKVLVRGQKAQLVTRLIRKAFAEPQPQVGGRSLARMLRRLRQGVQDPHFFHPNRAE